MRDTELYARILGIEEPWRVVGVELRLEEGEVEVVVEHGGEALKGTKHLWLYHGFGGHGLPFGEILQMQV